MAALKTTVKHKTQEQDIQKSQIIQEEKDIIFQLDILLILKIMNFLLIKMDKTKLMMIFISLILINLNCLFLGFRLIII